MQLNHAQRELTVKIVYYGPGLSGKTTNLQMVHQRTSPDVRGRLLGEGVLRRDDHKVFGLVPVHLTPQRDVSVERGLTDRLLDAVVLGHPASPRTAALASLVLAVGLEHHLFPRCDQRAIQRRIAALTGEQWVVEAVTHTINATNAALGIILPFDA